MNSKREQSPEPKRPAGIPNLAGAQARFREGLALHQIGQLAQAKTLYEQALRLHPGHFDALYLTGLLAAQTQNPDRAVMFFDKALQIAPENADVHNDRGIALCVLMRHAAAIESFDRAIAIRPAYAEAHFGRGGALQALKRFEAAIQSYDTAIGLDASYAEACNDRGLALQELDFPEDALASYDSAIALKPGLVQAHYNRGNALNKLQRFAEAVASYDSAIGLKPDYADAYNNRGLALQHLGHVEAAINSFDHAIAQNPGLAEAHSNRGALLGQLRRFEAALTSHDRAIALKPGFAEAHYNRGITFSELKQHQAALACYDRAIALDPGYAHAYNNRGNALWELKQYQAAVASYERALELKTDIEFVHGHCLHRKMQLCDWTDCNARLAELEQKIERGEKVSAAFPVSVLSRSPHINRKVAEIWVEAKAPENQTLGVISKRPRREKIRVAYFSADFRDHPVSILIAGLIEAHDRARFEVHAFSFGPDTRDSMRIRLENAFDKFTDVGHLPDREVAQLARSMDIDIAIDLGGHSTDSRLGIFACRAAPIQAIYIGYLGTTGAPYIDYLIADRTLIPDASREHYCEKIIYMPNSFQVSDSTRHTGEKVFTRQELGLPETGFVFCCFNNTYKITPETFAGWMRILKQTEGSVLWLLEDNPIAPVNLRQQAALKGVDPDRLIFAKRMPQALHLARQRAADLFIDTLPCNAGATASDALWAGLPLLTCMGETFTSRISASLLSAIELPEIDYFNTSAV